jgi:predicted transposase YbfD/YdcC
VVQSVICGAESAAEELIVSVPVSDVCGGLLELFAAVPDGRSGRGRDHPAMAVLAAVVAGMKGYAAITGWVADVPAAVLTYLYLRSGAAPAPPPWKSTIWRVLTDTDPDAFDAAVGAWLTGLAGVARRPAGLAGDSGGRLFMQVRLDGKTIRGARDAEGNQRHLLAALVGADAAASVVAAQAEVGAKTNEVPMAAVVLGQIDLTGKIVTADALHTVKATAQRIHEHGGQFVLPVKENRQALFDALNTLPWDQAPIAHATTDKGHGRITTRTIQVLPAPDDLPFPRVSQVFLIERYVTGLNGQPVSAVAALGVASPEPGQASPAALASYVRNNGRSNPCTGSATPSTGKTHPGSEPDPSPGSWPACAILPSELCAWPDAPTSPRPHDGPAAPWTGPSPSSDSHHNRGTTPGPASKRRRRA